MQIQILSVSNQSEILALFSLATQNRVANNINDPVGGGGGESRYLFLYGC